MLLFFPRKCKLDLYFSFRHMTVGGYKGPEYQIQEMTDGIGEKTFPLTSFEASINILARYLSAVLYACEVHYMSPILIVCTVRTYGTILEHTTDLHLIIRTSWIYETIHERNTNQLHWSNLWGNKWAQYWSSVLHGYTRKYMSSATQCSFDDVWDDASDCVWI